MMKALAFVFLLSACDAADVPLVAEPQCPTPHAPVLHALASGTRLSFGETVEVGSAALGHAPDTWDPNDSFVLGADDVSVFARAPGAAEACTFRADVHVVERFATDDGVAADDPRIVAWASTVTAVSWGRDNDADAEVAARALGPATGDTYDTASLGNGGRLTVGFDAPIVDGDGPDFVIFENGFSDQFLELAFVEVSTDGHTFVRFPTQALGMTPVSGYGTLDAGTVSGVAGRYRAGVGTTFDLALLRFDPDVRAGRVDLDRITRVRVVDIVGDGATSDSFGAPIYDPTPTYGTAGFDLEAVGVIND